MSDYYKTFSVVSFSVVSVSSPACLCAFLPVFRLVYLSDCVSVSLSGCLSVCLFVCLSVCLSIVSRGDYGLSVCMYVPYVCLSVCLPVGLFVSLSVFLSSCLPNCLSSCLYVLFLLVCLSVSVCLPVQLSVYLCLSTCWFRISVVCPLCILYSNISPTSLVCLCTSLRNSLSIS